MKKLVTLLFTGIIALSSMFLAAPAAHAMCSQGFHPDIVHGGCLPSCDNEGQGWDPSTGGCVNKPCANGQAWSDYVQFTGCTKNDNAVNINGNSVFYSNPYVASAMATVPANLAGPCTGDPSHIIGDAQDCMARATAQGQALGMNVPCRLNTSDLGKFTQTYGPHAGDPGDPVTGYTNLYNEFCTVDQWPNESAMMLAGWQRPAGSNAIISGIPPGWWQSPTPTYIYTPPTPSFSNPYY